VINITNGDSAAVSLAEALGSDRSIIVQHDVLSCGPFPLPKDVEHWIEVRGLVWGVDLPTECQSHELLQNADALRAADGVCLWMGAGLSDQLMIPAIVHLFTLFGIDPAKLSMIQFPGTIALGVLTAGRLKNHPVVESITPAGIAEAQRAWTAFTASDPSALLAFLNEGTAAFPFLRSAMKALIARYPDERSGLNYIDWELLKQTKAAGRKVGNVIVQTFTANNERFDPVGDMYLLERLKRLADPHLPYPAIDFSENSVELTSTGEAVLAGRKNFVDLNGIDDWVAGVHLDSRSGSVWTRRGEELVQLSL